VEDRTQAAQESACRATGGLSKNFGNLITHPVLKRVVAFVGWRERPPWIVRDEYEWLWLYGAVEPTTGTGVFLLLPTMEGTCLELFLRHLRHELGKGQIGVVLDSSGSHRSGAREMASWHASALFATLQSRIEPG
jgi:hypothetical protein